MLETHAFGNFIPQNIKYLLLGSFTAYSLGTDPGYDWFYSSKRNQFWSIIESVYEVKLPDKISKQKLFENLGIGVADIIYQCERSKADSSDLSLINIVYNPELENILRNNKIQKILFSSKYVEKLYKKVFKDLVNEFPAIEYLTLPSPSPRYAAISKDEKIKRYKKILCA